MAALARLLIVGFIVLTVIYVCLSLYSRAVRRGKLIRQWEAEGRPGDRAQFIAEGMRAYDSSLRKKLILGVYVVPVTLITVIIYLTNFY